MTGIALWRDGEVWHLRASEAGPDRAVFTGKIETDGVIKYVRRHLEGGDVTARAGRHDIAYRFTNYGRVDGIDFTVKCGAHLKIAGPPRRPPGHGRSGRDRQREHAPAVDPRHLRQVRRAETVRVKRVAPFSRARPEPHLPYHLPNLVPGCRRV